MLHRDSKKKKPQKFPTGSPFFELIRIKEHENPDDWICDQV
ncbi:hypothetical protein AQPE_2861 [Aquipluma nitroreducens]|uniref:Uncharacterized protein n=1 Tax=Aquipluma nitroreducens TaxID=2010828 RepID=A0A5K7SB79_9BACT|nr:hypothetical protein AQPE_2861 [Aquipluma nitroreducens]